MSAPPRKPVSEMSEDEFREWKQGLFAAGVNPLPIRREASASVSAYAWESDLRATVEHVNGMRYMIGLREGKLTRLRLLGPEIESENLAFRPDLRNDIAAGQFI
jgi:hypothetical protein